MCVFPGGGVDKRDFDAEIGWVGPTPAEWARLLGTDEAFARALVCAAVRETFEESGVLLAGPTEDTVVAGHHRRGLGGGPAPPGGAGGLLHRRSSSVAASGCAPTCCGCGARWVTPVFEPRRFNARFFVAEMPEPAR